MRIVKALLAGPLSVKEIVAAVEASQYNFSKHLRILRRAGIVEVEPDGTRRHYDIVEDFRRQLSKKNRVLDLGCCEFRFDRLEMSPRTFAARLCLAHSLRLCVEIGTSPTAWLRLSLGCSPRYSTSPKARTFCTLPLSVRSPRSLNFFASGICSEKSPDMITR